jgi:DNA-binding transcriptional LysR family regulator
MDLRQLECFIAVAEESSFTRAAGRLHIVQSAVSVTIASLERELHAQLVQRTSRRVGLTEAGLALLPKARATLLAAEEARNAVDDATGSVRGTLRLGTMSSLGLIDLPALLGHFHRAYPAVSVHLATAASNGGSPGLIHAIKEGTIDLAFVSIPGAVPPGARLTEVASTPLDLVILPDHRLAGRESVDISELAEESFIDFPVGYGNRAVADRAFESAGLQRRVVIEITSIASGADFVRHGLGVALLPRGAGRGRNGLSSLPVTNADLNWPISLATPTNRPLGTAARAFERVALGTRFPATPQPPGPAGDH